MFQNIMVPLDSSPLSEHALPLAVSIARRAKAALQLVTVRNPPLPVIGAGDPFIQPPNSTNDQKYLDQLAQQIRQRTQVEVWANVLEGPVVETLVEHARNLKSSLMVLTSHGRGPFSRFWLGSVTDELLRRGPVPLLIQRPTENAPPPIDRDWRPHQILVPLDGSPWSEAVVDPATELAKLMDAGLTLLRIVEPVPSLPPDGSAFEVDKLLENSKTQARAQLETIAERLRKGGLGVLTRLAYDDRVATAILEESRQFDLMAFATHGRSNLARVVLGSVADKLVRGAAGPVLVVHPTQH